ncbi:MAG: hypothetical protein IPK19_36840 [Chloroflexi bacterium]|nr:hypothetical protein [Chloroflexota bacterium]
MLARIRAVPWLTPVMFVLLTLLARLPYLGLNAHQLDYHILWHWSQQMYEANVGFYSASQANHPPLYLSINGLTVPLSFATDAGPGLSNKIRLSLPSVIADLILVAVAAHWLRDRGRTRAVVLLLLALHPGLIINSAMWTQSDAIFTLFLVFTVMALHDGRPRVAWILYAFAMLTKAQSIVLLPLLVIVTYRRHSLNILVRAALTGASVWWVGLLPFIVGSGLEATLRPYTGAVNYNPITTMNAYNVWVAFDPGYWQGIMGPNGSVDAKPSWIPGLQMLTHQQVGLILMTAYMLPLFLLIWRRAHEHHEFLWAAALYFGFFMLPTQIHDRYLYPGIVMATFAISQDRRIILVVLFSMVTFTYNLLAVTSEPALWIGTPLSWLVGNFPPHTALANVMLFGVLVMFLVFRRSTPLLKVARYLAVIAILALLLTRHYGGSRVPTPAVFLSDVHVADAAIIAYRIGFSENQASVDLFMRAERPILTRYDGMVELLAEGEVIAMQDSSDSETYPGSWRWTQWGADALTYSVDLTDLPMPDQVRVTFREYRTGRTLDIRRGEASVEENNLTLAVPAALLGG